MRTNIEIDDALMEKAIRLAGVETKKAAVEEGLRLLVRTRAQVAMKGLRGKVKWVGDLDQLRRGRTEA